MSQVNHDNCWIPASDPPQTQRRIIIWTKKRWAPKGSTLIDRHLDTGGAWYSVDEGVWYHGDGHVAIDVTHWTEMPRNPVGKDVNK